MKPIPIYQMVFRQRSAPAVWLALCEIANESGSHHIKKSRETISKLCGIKPQSISRALAGLEYGGWIKKRVIRIKKGNAFVSKLRISLRKPWRISKRSELAE